jgi:PDZ domain
MNRIPIFIFGISLLIFPFLIKLFFELRPLPLADGGIIIENYIKSDELSIAIANLKPYQNKPHLIKYEGFLNIRKASNSLDLPRGAVKANLFFNCSTRKHFIEDSIHYKYNDFSSLSYINKQKFYENIEVFNKKYSDVINTSKKFSDVFNGNCPYFINALQFSLFEAYGGGNQSSSGLQRVGGIGLRFELIKDGALVIGVNDNSPADNAKLSIGDIIVEINGYSIRNNDSSSKMLFKVISLLGGVVGSDVLLNVLKSNTNNIESYSLTRNDFVETLKYEFNLNNDGIRLTDPSDNVLAIKCDYAKPFPYNESLVNIDKPMIIEVIQQIDMNGTISGNPIITYPIDTGKLHYSYLNNFAQSIPKCDVTHLPKVEDGKKIFFSRRFIF